MYNLCLGHTDNPTIRLWPGMCIFDTNFQKRSFNQSKGSPRLLLEGWLAYCVLKLLRWRKCHWRERKENQIRFLLDVCRSKCKSSFKKWKWVTQCDLAQARINYNQWCDNSHTWCRPSSRVFQAGTFEHYSGLSKCASLMPNCSQSLSATSACSIKE